jgi:hypothetical protein
MKNQLIMMALGMLVKFLSPELIKDLWNSLKEKVDLYVENSENKIDDFIISALENGGDELKFIMDAILDFLEEKVLGSASKIDDALVLPVVNLIRISFDIPDND